MAEASGENLRALIRLIPPARALGKELDRMVALDLAESEGMGDIATKNFKGLLDSVTKLVDDPYPETLAVELPTSATDKQKILAVRLANSQLIAYLEAQAGVFGREEVTHGGENFVLNLQNAKIGNLGEGFEKMGEMFSKMFGGTKFGEEFARHFKERFGAKEKKEEGKENEE